MKLYKYKAYGLYYLALILGKILGISIPPIPSASGLIVNKKKEILVVRLSYENGVALPGGIVEKGESLKEAVTREVFEETGFTVTKAKFYASYPIVKKIRYGISSVFLVEVKGNLRDSKEGRPIWMKPKDALGECVYPDNIAFLKEYFTL